MLQTKCWCARIVLFFSPFSFFSCSLHVESGHMTGAQSFLESRKWVASMEDTKRQCSLPTPRARDSRPISILSFSFNPSIHPIYAFLFQIPHNSAAISRGLSSHWTHWGMSPTPNFLFFQTASRHFPTSNFLWWTFFFLLVVSSLLNGEFMYVWFSYVCLVLQ